MTVRQLRKDFEKSFPNWELKRTKDGSEHASYHTQAAWLAWVSSYETYVGQVHHD